MADAPTQRPLNIRRARTFEENQRRNSTLSDTLSEARNSIRSSTDDLFLPRVEKGHGTLSTEESHWHSAPLGLALLPAIAGIFFHEGSSFVTDVTILVLAAIFLNWSVRLPWDWYRSAQAIRHEESGFPAPGDPPFELDDQEQHKDAATAISELQIHELIALATCFIFPLVGTGLLHAIRSSLSRPSEGLVSNYNLTIFLLASEVRPVSHLLRLIQKRTLHLQRIVSSATDPIITPTTLQDLVKRLEELEAHVAETATARLATKPNTKDPSQKVQEQDQPQISPALVANAALETRKAIQPDIEALNRAVRRYEKRSALFSLQTDQRFVRLETQAGDALALAAAATRSAESRRPNYALVLLDWACACVVVPARIALSLVGLPGRAVSECWLGAKRMLIGRKPAPQQRSKSKSSKGKARAGSSGVYRQGGGLVSQRRSEVRNGDGG
ncbi:hypothetical protein DTO006G1_5293 [Penicillium roqueforti]|uniref:uncharacterized protein n=1 Tax=Penicillium roqueforti TaxID=5082 RepID=UPI00190DF792|nr:uncharacterized protein LCP9604111_3383 [Penicillium roqueforti]KAF9250481.1 hypothetical protein LCP9604111_3383 [Penicillium roqueforti]KAI1833168.1 hypothetical protein CBS147337_6125 [Penicillium roqueforti]KAI2679044.1 hypothetical protein LCP963914a_7623 [Penicillium roqueforti]KAI2698820.1 hypothetical protein CBS147372_6667 [Penicillium roqueforti]KAI2716414.1 hypothetical protein CBS147318_5528 [Penicillium roqueforti]